MAKREWRDKAADKFESPDEAVQYLLSQEGGTNSVTGEYLPPELFVEPKLKPERNRKYSSLWIEVNRNIL